MSAAVITVELVSDDLFAPADLVADLTAELDDHPGLRVVSVRALRRPPVREMTPELSDIEHRIVAGVASGRTNAQLATELFLSLASVKRHLAGLMQKLGVSTRAEVAAKVRDLGAV